MSQSDWQQSFEEYRRDRTARRLQDGHAHRPLGPNADVLQELEAAEQRELHNARLTREVQDFLEDATRTVATLVKQVTAEQEQSCAERIRDEMEDFLSDVIRRAETFMQALRVEDDPRAEAHLEPRLGNLVGRPLDAFRHEGTAELADKHIGQDPFKTAVAAEEEREERSERPLPEVAEERRPERSQEEARPRVVDPMAEDEDEDRLEDHIVACSEVGGGATASGPADDDVVAPEAGAHPLLSRLAQDPAKLERALKLLIESGVLSRDDAVAIADQLVR